MNKTYPIFINKKIYQNLKELNINTKDITQTLDSLTGKRPNIRFETIKVLILINYYQVLGQTEFLRLDKDLAIFPNEYKTITGLFLDNSYSANAFGFGTNF